MADVKLCSACGGIGEIEKYYWSRPDSEMLFEGFDRCGFCQGTGKEYARQINDRPTIDWEILLQGIAKQIDKEKSK